VDALGPVLAQFRFQSDLYCLLRGAGSWGLSIPRASGTAYIHSLRGGRCALRMGSETIKLSPGDVVLLPHGAAHDVLGEEHDQAVPLDIAELVERRRQGADRVFAVGHGDVRTEMVCGGYAFDHNGFNPVLDFLPPLVHLSAATTAEPRMESILNAAANELTSPGLGSDLALERLGDLLLITALRSCVSALRAGDGGNGWLRGLSDPSTAAALHAIHTKPEQPWTLDRLAEQAAVSTSTLTARFSSHVGMSPHQYLTRWRMLTAASHLSSTSWTLDEIAARVGYGSGPAFNKAFKAEFGMPPGEFRRAERSAG